jgi:membrane protease YdiL (CAAX protease family)
MSGASIQPSSITAPRVGRAGLGLLLGGLAGVVAIRWLATELASLDRVGVGFLFGIGLLGLAVASGWRPSLHWSGFGSAVTGRVRPSLDVPWPLLPALLVGVGGAIGLIVLAMVTAGHAGRWSPGASFWPWAAVTVLVATTEEIVLRGLAFGRLAVRFGLPVAVLATSVVFALIHVPAYGWRAVPLDLGVGLVLGGLRVVAGRVAAPAIAHVLADLATWWI